MYYIALLLSIITSIMFIASLFKKDKSSMLKIQLLETGINIIKNILLQGYSGALVQCFGLVRNYLGYKNITSKPLFGLIIAGQLILGVILNNNGAYGYLPIIASVSYTAVIMVTKHAQILRYALVINLILWAIYQLILKDYPAIASTSLSLVFIGIAITKERNSTNEIY